MTQPSSRSKPLDILRAPASPPATPTVDVGADADVTMNVEAKKQSTQVEPTTGQSVSVAAPQTRTPKPDSAEDAQTQSPSNAGDPGVRREFGGPKGPEPTRYGDWERKGRCVDF